MAIKVTLSSMYKSFDNNAMYLINKNFFKENNRFCISVDIRGFLRIRRYKRVFENHSDVLGSVCLPRLFKFNKIVKIARV